jgi:hypothetical protein
MNWNLNTTLVIVSKLVGVRCGTTSRCGETLLVETMRTIISYQKMTHYEECYNWFWTSINLDETYSKEFLEYLQQLMRDIDSGKEKVYPMDDVMGELKKWMENPDDEDT